MKNYLMFALLVCATASMAFGQFGVADAAEIGVQCPAEECHVAPVFVGEGGFVGEIADGFDSVNFVASCGSTSTSVKADPDSDGIVRVPFTMDNGLACHDEDGGSIEIHGLMDGGWYWVNDSMNSAVSALLAKDTLGNDAVEPTDPGGVSLTAAEYGTFVKHEASGRVGIIPHILPEPMAAAAAICGPRYWNDPPLYYVQTGGCSMGDGGTTIALTGPANAVGLRTRITSGMVYRPYAGAGVTVSFGLWGNGSGHISTAAGAVAGTNTPAALKGWDIRQQRPDRIAAPMPFTTDFMVDLPDSPNTSLASAGIRTSTGAVLDTVTPTVVVPGAEDTAFNGRGDDNAATTPEIDNGWGMFGGELVYCKQEATEDLSGDTVLHFAGAGGTTIMVTDTTEPTPDDTSDSAIAALGASDDWAAQATWVAAWNGAAAAAMDIETVEVTNDLGTANPADDTDHEVPQVVCATQDGTPTPMNATDGIVIEPSSAYCSASNNRSVRVRIYTLRDTARANNTDVLPPIGESAARIGGQRVAAATMLNVMCAPASSANQGQELVPGNPFPTDE